MKIKEDSLLNLIQSKDYIKHHTDFAMDMYVKHKHEAYIHKIFLLDQRGFRRLVFSNKSTLNLQNYKITKDIRIDVLKTLPNRKDIILLNTDEAIQYIKANGSIKVAFHTISKKDNGVHFYFLYIDLKTGEVIMDDVDTNQLKVMTKSEMIEKFYSKFLQVITYLELTEVELKTLRHNQSEGTMKQGKVKNLSKQDFILVNTNWNTKIYLDSEFKVRGHFRLQPYGSAGNRHYKFIFIDSYIKKGITINAKKETAE